MGRIIERFKGKEISEEKIAKIRTIASKRYSKAIYNSSYWNVETIEDLAYLHDINVNDEIVILGDDWFLCYTELDDEVTILEWVAVDNKEHRLIQSIEMMNTFNRILIQNKTKLFKASMRHDSSYQFYCKMLKKEFFNEQSHTLEIDNCYGYAPERLKYLEEEYSSLEHFLDSNEAKEHSEYLKFILHCLEFYITDDFSKRFIKLKK